jgi:hypothetical protein
VDFERLFTGQETKLHPMLASADRLLKFAQDQRGTILRLLGYDVRPTSGT